MSLGLKHYKYNTGNYVIKPYRVSEVKYSVGLFASLKRLSGYLSLRLSVEKIYVYATRVDPFYVSMYAFPVPYCTMGRRKKKRGKPPLGPNGPFSDLNSSVVLPVQSRQEAAAIYTLSRVLFSLN
jgi:hypothetical protein